MIEIEGFFSDGKSSRLTPATLTYSEGDSIILSLEDRQIPVESEQVIISSRLGNSARYLTLGDHGRLETRSNEAVDALEKKIKGSSGSRLLHRLESNLGLILVAVVATAVITWAFLQYGLPIAADKLVDSLPEKTTDIIEDKLITRMEKRWFEPSQLPMERQEEIQALFSEVLAKTITEPNQQTHKYRFRIYDAEDSVGANALAFPSGLIVMTDQLIELADSDAQIAGVLAHEIGHLQGKHSLRQMMRGSILTLVIAFITGDVSGASSALLSAPAFLLELRFSREFETEADGYAVKYFGCDEQGLRDMGDFFLKLGQYQVGEPSDTASDKHSSGDAAQQKEEKSSTVDFEMEMPDFLSTHPGSLKRKEYFEQHIRAHCKS